MFASFATRLSAAVLVTAGIALTLVVGLTVMRLHQGLHRQTVDLGRISEDQLMRTLDSTALLAKAQIDTLYNSTRSDLSRLAGRNDVVRAVRSRNSVAMWELLGRLGDEVGLDNVIVADPQLRVIGAAREDTDILAANENLQRQPLAQQVRADILEAEDSQDAYVHQAVKIAGGLQLAIAAQEPAPIAFIAAVPVYDDFGEVLGVLIAHRTLRQNEPSLQQLARISGGLLVVVNGEVVSSAGDLAHAGPPKPNHDRLSPTADGGYWARCTEFGSANICAVAPQSELAALRAGMVLVGEKESAALTRWLIIVAVLALAGLAGVAFVVSQSFARPLAAITNAVWAVSRGDWKSVVPALNRSDEIGNIARAVALMQRSLEERDRLRLGIESAETALKRQDHVETAIRRFDRKIRTIMLDISDNLEAINEVSSELDRSRMLAEGDVLEAGFICRQAQDKIASSVAKLEAAVACFAAGEGSSSRLRQELEQAGDAHSSASAAALAMSNLSVSLIRIKTGLKESQDSSTALLAKVAAVADGADRLDHTIKSFLRDISDKSLSPPISTAA